MNLVGAFLSKIRALFFNFEKGQGRPPPHVLSVCIEITLKHRCSLVNWMHIFGPLFLKNASGGLLLYLYICWVFTAFAKNVFLLVPTKVLELGFPNALNKSLMKCGKIVSCVIQYSKKIWEVTRNLGAHPHSD